MKKLFVLIVLIILVAYLFEIILNFEKILLLSFQEKLTSEQLSSFLLTREKYNLISYLIIVLLYIIKISLITSFIYIGTFFFSRIKITFKQLFNAVVKAEFIFLGVGVFKIIWFYFFQTSYTLEDIQYFYPLSALNIIGYEGLEAWFIYPLQTLNLFELAYWLLLAYFIGKLTQSTTEKGLKIVATSYGSALLLWVCVIMFFTLSYS